MSSTCLDIAASDHEIWESKNPDQIDRGFSFGTFSDEFKMPSCGCFGTRGNLPSAVFLT